MDRDLWPDSLRFAVELLDGLDRASRSADGILTRQPYAVGEQVAHDLITSAGDALGLESQTDFAGNLHLTFPGRSSSTPRWITGSHLDSVPDGGNFDGAAGVIAGLAVMHHWRKAAITPVRDVTLIAFRAEEASSWFTGKHHSHFGSRSLLGQLTHEELHETRSVADGRSLAAWMMDAGFHPERLGSGTPLVALESIHGYAELHIEQGPVLVRRGYPVGIVTGIRGTLRARSARCVGEDAHSGAVPIEYRRDALFAAAELAVELERRWHRWLAEGRDVVCTLGRFGTVPARHSMTKVPGEVEFSVDIRSLDASLLSEAREFLQARVEEISAARGVRLELGPLDLSPPALMDGDLQVQLSDCARSLGVPAISMASGAGHDAANFAAAGIPPAMIFVRNDHGSHNRNEAMAMEDFAQGAAVLEQLLAS